MSVTTGARQLQWPELPKQRISTNTLRRAHVEGLYLPSSTTFSFEQIGEKKEISWNNEGDDSQYPADVVWYSIQVSDRPHFHAATDRGHSVAVNMWLRLYANLAQDDGHITYPAKLTFNVYAKVEDSDPILLSSLQLSLQDNGNAEWWKLGRVRGAFVMGAGEKCSFFVELANAQDSSNPSQQLTLDYDAIQLLSQNPTTPPLKTEVKVIMY